MKRHAKKDPVTPEMRVAVLTRDQGCVAVRLDRHAGQCRGRLTLDHVHTSYSVMGKRAPSDMAHLVTLCELHHLYNGWATSHRAELREYLRSVNEATDSTIPPTSRSGGGTGRV